MHTNVGIIGAGPSGLMLAHLLALQGIDSVVLESHSREHVEKRMRAGVLEHSTVELLKDVGLGERLMREGLQHKGIWLRFAGESHRIDFPRHTGGKSIMVYGQQEVVKDLIAARLATGQALHFETEAMRLCGLEEKTPTIEFSVAKKTQTLTCDFVAGCDGFHGVARKAIPAGVLQIFERHYPFAWLGILAHAAPASHELIYANHERGFALHSMRSGTVSRNYIQVAHNDSTEQWPDEAIWDELDRRLATKDGFVLNRGEIFEKSVTGMRAFVAEPMQYNRLFLAGDAAHIVPPTGAKGMNLAIHDVRVLADALTDFYQSKSEAGLKAYSSTCLKRVWRAQHFSWWMTQLLHQSNTQDPYEHRLQLAQLELVCTNETATRGLAEQYIGMLGGNNT